MKRLLRVCLPPLRDLHADSQVSFVRLQGEALVGEGTASLFELGGESNAAQFILHPGDSLLAAVQLPPLPKARIAPAVGYAAEALILGGLENTHLAHGPRQGDGRLTLAWLDRAELQRLLRLLRDCQLRVGGLYAAPFFLPIPADHGWVAWVRDGYLVVRAGVHDGFVHPAPDVALRHLATCPAHLSWIEGPVPPPAGPPGCEVRMLPAERRWSGEAPNWGLHTGMQADTTSGAGWGKAALCCAGAILVWTLGLNLYAARITDQAQVLKAQMSARVKQAFPQLPVVLNPLEQARRQRDARLTDMTSDGGGFAGLVRHAAQAMPFMDGAVESLVYQAGELRLGLMADARKAPGDASWQATLAQAGLEASADPAGWRLRAVAPGARMAAEEPGEAADE